MRRPSLFQPPLLLILLTCSSASAAVFQNDFSAYPANTQSCLYAAANSSSCDGSTATAMNECLCGNGGDFVSNSAKCIGQQDPADSISAFVVMQSSCSTSNTPLSISLSDWEADVANGTSTSAVTSTSATSTSSTSTSTSASNSVATTTTTATTATASATSAASPNQISSSAKIGIGVGCAAAAVAVLVAIIIYILRRRRLRRNGGDEMTLIMADAHNQSPPGFAAHQLPDLSYGHAEPGSAVPSTAGSKHANTWASSPSFAGAPWSPNSYNSINTDGQRHDFYRPPPHENIYELAGDGAHSSFAGPLAELPIPPEPPSQIASPCSGYSEMDDISITSPRPVHHELSAEAEGRSLM